MHRQSEIESEWIGEERARRAEAEAGDPLDIERAAGLSYDRRRDRALADKIEREFRIPPLR